jgi:hypothetical protein
MNPLPRSLINKELPSPSLVPVPSSVAEPAGPWEPAHPPAETRRVFGNRLGDLLIRELPAGDNAQDLASLQWLMEAGHTAQKALAGVDFVTCLDHSAVLGGRQFNALVTHLGLEGLDLRAREHIDKRMKLRFEQAVQAGTAPVDPQTAYKWLKNELLILT